MSCKRNKRQQTDLTNSSAGLVLDNGVGNVESKSLFVNFLSI